MWKPDLCIYHGSCNDGFGAAWAIWTRWGNEVAYVPGTYGKPLPDVTGRNVLFVDFSAPYDQIVEMSQKARSIVIIDHHKSAQADLARLLQFDGTGADQTSLEGAFFICKTHNMPEIAAWFDMNQSGAVMAWEFAHGIERNDPPPNLLAYIQDHDLWRFAFGDRTRQFTAALQTYPMTFETWDNLARRPDELVREGEPILRAHNINVAKLLEESYLDYVGEHYVPIANVPYHYASDVGNQLLKKYPDAPFSASWYRRGDGMIKWSLRSEDSREDVSKVAAMWGGGGHRNAAGFECRG